uniref:Uncharacterized protein n=1 Tax=Arundo donax TaxID=35708 RepID=A0A0A9ECQ1_ARUDO
MVQLEISRFIYSFYLKQCNSSCGCHSCLIASLALQALFCNFHGHVMFIQL